MSVETLTAIDKERCQNLMDVALSYAKGKVDEIEVLVMASDVATSRFANNEMTQNQHPQRTEISVRALKDGKQARLSSDRISTAAIKELVDNAVTTLGFIEKDPGLLPLYNPNGQPENGGNQKQRDAGMANRFDQATAAATAKDRAQRIASAIEIANKQKLSAAGICASGTKTEAIANSNGLFKFHQETESEWSVTMSASDSTGWAKAHSPRLPDLHTDAMAQSAAQKAIASANPKEIDPGKYTVILEPSAVLDLLIFLWWDFAATSHKDKLSCFLDQIGKKILGTNINITDDVFHPLQAGAFFDGEGIDRQRVELVKNGVIENLVYGRRTAQHFKTNATGHGLAEPNTMGEHPVNLVVAGGNNSLEQIIAGTEHGVLLTRVWYVREVDPSSKIVTGMTRDGTFLVENGKIKHGLKNLRFNQSLIEMLNNVTQLGMAVRSAGEESFPAVVPAMKISDFNFASTTKF